MDRVLNKVGLGLALFFMVAELTYLNAKSLLYLTGTDGIDKVFAVVGAFAFSMVTVVVMRKNTKGFVKMVFPWFDAALMFLGLNLKYADQIINGTDNPLRLSITIFMSLLAGLTTYSLGIINYKEHEAIGINVVAQFKDNINTLTTHLDAKTNELASVNAHLEAIKNETANIDEYRRAYLVAERSRILKKRPENRTEKEQAILAQSETV